MTWLLAAALVLPIVVAVGAAWRRGGVEVDHVVLFSAGFLLYWVTPVAAGAVRLFTDEPALALWYRTWDAAAASGGLNAFVLFALASYLAFVGGSWVGARARSPRPSGRPAPFERDPRLLRLFLPPAVALTAVYAWTLRGELFTGYRAALGQDRSRGTLTACSLLLLVLFLLRWAEAPRWPWPRRGVAGRLLDPFLLAYLGSAVLLLSLGGRLYVISALLMVLAFRSVYERRISVPTVLAACTLGAIAAGVVGTLRLGYAPSPQGVALNLLLEPLFTGFSLLHFIAQDNVPWVTLPRFLLSDFINLVPTALLPMKAQLLLDPQDYGFSIFSPAGAMNSFVSFTINFGILGTPFVMFVLGACLGALKRTETAFLRVMYCMLSAWLAFTFFRDGFSVSVVKNMFQFSVLVPLLVVVLSHVMTVIAPRRPAARPAARDASWT